LPQSNKILCTHYTLVNYEPGYALSKEGFVGGTFTYTQYEYGSAWCNRDVIYGDWLKTNRFRYTLAGHAHRLGLYKCTPESRDNMLQRLGATARSNFASLGDPTATLGRVLHPVDNAMNITKNSLPKLKTQGYLPTPEVLANWGDKTKILVSSSAGCLAKQNVDGELSGQGMDYPAATLLYFDGDERIEIMPTSHPKAKPRFAVSCDYIDIKNQGFWEYFKAVGKGGTFELKPFWEKIHPKLGEDKPKFIDSVVLWIIENDEAKPYNGTMTVSGSIFKVILPDTLPDKLKSRSKHIDALFLSLKFNGAAFKGVPGFNHYDFTSPWNIQIELFNKVFEEGLKAIDDLRCQPGFGMSEKEIVLQLEALNKRKDEKRFEDMAIRRHKENGEIPDFEWRMTNWPAEFANSVIKQKKKA
jgi:hypothetical protein